MFGILMMRENPFRPLDESKLKFFHVKSLFTTGMGVFTDGYDLYSIGIVLLLVLSSYGLKPGSPGFVFYASWVSGSALIGSVVGALIFGYLANMGRKKFYGVDVAILTIGAFLQAFAPNAFALTVLRFILGIGIGADYVLSPTIMAEHSNARDRGKLLALGFAMFWVFGAVTAGAVSLLLGVLHVSPDLLWRIVLGAGAIPAASVIYLRRKIPETARYLGRIKGNVEGLKRVVREVANVEVQVSNDIKDPHGFGYYFRRNAVAFIGAMLLWFLYDLVGYSGVLFGPTSIGRVLFLSPGIFVLITELGFIVPGGVIAIFLIDRVGRKPLQIIGFIGMATFLLAFSGYLWLTGTSFNYATGALVIGPTFLPIVGLFLYGLYLLMMQIGPGSISAAGLLGVELAPTKVRGWVQSFTVVAGRLGAAIASFVFPGLMAAYGLSFAVAFLSSLMFIAAIITFLMIPETKGKSLEAASGEMETDVGETK
jgi:putative MFS transporter